MEDPLTKTVPICIEVTRSCEPFAATAHVPIAQPEAAAQPCVTSFAEQTVALQSQDVVNFACMEVATEGSSAPSLVSEELGITSACSSSPSNKVVVSRIRSCAGKERQRLRWKNRRQIQHAKLAHQTPPLDDLGTVADEDGASGQAFSALHAEDEDIAPLSHEGLDAAIAKPTRSYASVVRSASPCQEDSQQGRVPQPSIRTQTLREQVDALQASMGPHRTMKPRPAKWGAR